MHNVINSKNKLKYYFLYKIVIVLIYIMFISNDYNYMGLSLDISLYKFATSIILMLVVIFISPKNGSFPSTYIYILLEVFILIPILSYYWLNNQQTVYIIFVVLSFIVIGLIFKLNLKFLTFILRIPDTVFYSILVFYLLITCYLIIQRGGIDYRALDFNLIYELRSENEISGILGYFLNWATKVFFPLFLVYFLYNKNIFMIILTISLQILMYLSYGNKAFLFSIGLVLLIYLVIKYSIFLKGIVISFVLLNISSVVLYFFNVTDALYRAIPYRMIFIPSQIQYLYYDYFKHSDKLYLSENLIGELFNVKDEYTIPIARVISRVYLNNNSHSNTGIFADAFANGGYVYMLVAAIVLAILILLVDVLTPNIPIYISVGSLSYIIFVINDTGLLTTLLTGGLLLQLILLILLNSVLFNRKQRL